MKILHTGDWHLGKIVNEYSMLDDQAYILNQLLEIIKNEQPDCIIVAGDIYDRSIPPKEAVELLDEILDIISFQYQIPTLIISGNHDSHERLQFGKRFLEKSQLYIEGKMGESIRKVVLTDEYGPVNFYLLPFVNPTYARIQWGIDSITDYDSLMRYLVDLMNIDETERNVLINHNFFTENIEEAYTSDSERSLSIGGTEVIDVEQVKHFDYVALGHLHRPQKVRYNHVRYSGSLLKYSASEINTEKGVYIVELGNKGTDLEIDFKPLVPLRDFVEIKGTLNELLSPQFYQQINTEDYLQVVLTDTDDLYDPLGQLRAIYPRIMQIERPYYMISIEGENRQKNIKNKTPWELYQDFYTYVSGEELNESQQEVILNMMEKFKELGDHE